MQINELAAELIRKPMEFAFASGLLHIIQTV